MLCVKCGSENDIKAKVCGKCGAVLPRYEAEIKPEPEEVPVVNERLQIFEDAAAKVTSGEWQMEEFAAFLQETAAVMAEKEDGIRSIDIPEEAADDFKEELEIGFEGIELYNQGLEHMFAYTESAEPELLEAGLDLIRQGNERINEAMRINRENRSRLEEICGDGSVI